MSFQFGGSSILWYFFCTFSHSAFSVSLPFSGLTELENSVGNLRQTPVIVTLSTKLQIMLVF